VFGDTHLETAQSLNNLAVFQYQRRAEGDLDEAATLLGEALRIREGQLGADHPLVANTRNNLANVLLSTDRADESEALFRAAIRGWTATFGPDHVRLAAGWWGLAKALERRGDVDGAIDAVRRTQAIEAAGLPAEHPNHALGRERLAALEAMRGARGAAPTGVAR
jgi:tetratricopeptide (TPR) repeat protein